MRSRARNLLIAWGVYGCLKSLGADQDVRGRTFMAWKSIPSAVAVSS